MLDIIKYIASIFVDLYNLLDINMFPDIGVSYIELLIGIILLCIILKLVLGTEKDANLSISNGIKDIFERNKKGK